MPLDGVEVMVLDDNNQKVDANTVGHIYIKSQTLMKSYYDTSLNKDVLCEFNGDIWLNTGDMGYVDETGHVYFKEREKRLIKISGINVFPNEIEDIVNDIEEIKISCAIQGEKDNKPIIVLYVQLNKGFEYTDALEKKIKDIISKKLLKYSMPSKIIPIDNIPLTQIGKVDYKKLR